MHEISKNETFLPSDLTCAVDDAKRVGPMTRLGILALSVALPLAGTYTFSEPVAVHGKPVTAVSVSIASDPGQDLAFAPRAVEQELDAKN